ncbi:MAG: YjiH family protein [Proteobacteria bacterium]|nr:YjiH family protein [Pseudomonadota bacterium]
MNKAPQDVATDPRIEPPHAGDPAPDARAMWRFAIPSLVGVLTFLTPIKVAGNWTIVMGFLSDWTTAAMGGAMVFVVLGLLWISALGSALVRMIRPGWADPGTLGARLFMVSTLWLVLRGAGAIMGTMTVLRVGPEVFWHASTGATVMNDLAVKLLPLFLFAGFLMPFLTDYGLMEFCGTVLKRVFRFLFGLPGRSAVDVLASWLASAPVGVLVTIQQYTSGYYTKREAAVIATNFSIVSVPFAFIVANTVGLGHRFLAFYAAVVVTGLTVAIIMPRIPPLSRITDEHRDGVVPRLDAEPTGSLFVQAVTLAARRAVRAPSLGTQVRIGIGYILDIWIGLVPAVIVVGGLGLMLAEFTPVLGWLTAPLVPVLELLGMAEATTAAPALIAGFLDMFLPALLVANVDAEPTRYAIGVVSVTQLIYMSEVGILLLRCEIPLKFHHLIAVFLLRTAISLPLVLLFARLVL